MYKINLRAIVDWLTKLKMAKKILGDLAKFAKLNSKLVGVQIAQCKMQLKLVKTTTINEENESNKYMKYHRDISWW